jgi:hypothetical protein
VEGGEGQVGASHRALVYVASSFLHPTLRHAVTWDGSGYGASLAASYIYFEPGR